MLSRKKDRLIFFLFMLKVSIPELKNLFTVFQTFCLSF